MTDSRIFCTMDGTYVCELCNCYADAPDAIEHMACCPVVEKTPTHVPSESLRELATMWKVEAKQRRNVSGDLSDTTASDMMDSLASEILNEIEYFYERDADD